MSPRFRQVQPISCSLLRSYPLPVLSKRSESKDPAHRILKKVAPELLGAIARAVGRGGDPSRCYPNLSRIAEARLLCYGVGMGKRPATRATRRKKIIASIFAGLAQSQPVTLEEIRWRTFREEMKATPNAAASMSLSYRSSANRSLANLAKAAGVKYYRLSVTKLPAGILATAAYYRLAQKGWIDDSTSIPLIFYFFNEFNPARSAPPRHGRAFHYHCLVLERSRKAPWPQHTVRYPVPLRLTILNKGRLYPKKLENTAVPTDWELQYLSASGQLRPLMSEAILRPCPRHRPFRKEFLLGDGTLFSIGFGPPPDIAMSHALPFEPIHRYGSNGKAEDTRTK